MLLTRSIYMQKIWVNKSMNIWLKTWRCRNKETWNYYRDEPSNPLSSDSESFKYKTTITWNTYKVDKKITDDDVDEIDNPKYDGNEAGKYEAEVVIPLKHLSNFWRSLNIPLINFEVELILTWSKNCVLADMTVTLIFDWNSRHKTVCSSCNFVKRKWHKTLRTIKIRI